MLIPIRALAVVVAGIAMSGCANSDSVTSPAESPPATVPPEMAVASNSWTNRAPMPNAWRGFSAGVMNNAVGQPLVYVLGGSLDNNFSQNRGVLIYDPATNSWTEKRIANGVVFRTRSNGIGRIGDVLYLTGGFNLSEVHDFNSGVNLMGGTIAYRPKFNTTIHASGPPRATADGVTGVIGGLLYVLVGTAKASETASCDEFSCPLGTFRTLYRYNPATDRWLTKKSAPHFHRNGAGGVINGKFYVAGGYDAQKHATRDLDAYDPATDSWKTLAPLPQTLTGLKGAVLQNRLYIIATQATYAYNPATNSWAVRAPPPPNTAAQAGAASAVTVTLGGQQRIIVAGGGETTAGPRPTSLYTP